ncbi:class I adenylate-forming enzyme family protein [Eleftheria terrae]|uniref:class I adenylate-forming enzyme family protein n=1 Tax=Eleftheria terrae TaxID=1597781 RepID=UPI00263B2AFE|nr:AMP-binding protein [Eleftheria terrae]WKB54262.1 AMP-binding protein [Eleftheria terrae]
MTASSPLAAAAASVDAGSTCPVLPARLHQVIDRWARDTPSAPALEDATQQLSYAELQQRVAAAGKRLAAAGLRPGDRLLVVAENCAAAALLALACSTIDAWCSLVNARLSPREVDAVIEHAGPRRVVVLEGGSAEAAAHARRLGAAAQDWPELGALHLGALNEDCRPEPVHAAASEQVAALVYTSGTSGSPKGVMLTHANLLFIAENGRRMRRLVPGDRVWGVLPLSHVYGLTSVLLATLHAGASLVLVPRFDAAEMARALAVGGITVLHGVPAMYAKLLAWSRQPGHVLRAPALRVAQSGGAPLDEALKAAVEQALGVVLHNGYGMTEAAPSIAQTRLDTPRRDASVGMPIPGTEVRIVDLQRQQPVPGGETGELWVRGPQVMKGYYRDAVLTRQTVNAEGWLHTGDLARLAPDGVLEVVGRSKELIIRSGFNVYPVEVEQALCAHPDVMQAAVVGRPVPGNEEVVAFVEPVPGRQLEAGTLQAWLRERLSPYKLPSAIVLMAQLPASTTGKVAKARLRELAQQPLAGSCA